MILSVSEGVSISQRFRSSQAEICETYGDSKRYTVTGGFFLVSLLCSSQNTGFLVIKSIERIVYSTVDDKVKGFIQFLLHELVIELLLHKVAVSEELHLQHSLIRSKEIILLHSRGVFCTFMRFLPTFLVRNTLTLATSYIKSASYLKDF